MVVFLQLPLLVRLVVESRFPYCYTPPFKCSHLDLNLEGARRHRLSQGEPSARVINASEERGTESNSFCQTLFIFTHSLSLSCFS